MEKIKIYYTISITISIFRGMNGQTEIICKQSLFLSAVFERRSNQKEEIKIQLFVLSRKKTATEKKYEIEKYSP